MPGGILATDLASIGFTGGITGRSMARFWRPGAPVSPDMRHMCDRPTVSDMGAAVELDAGGRAVRLSNPDKVYFPEKGYTKRDVAEYFLAVGPGITRALNHRPTTLQRFVDGVEGDFFYQKRAPKNLPEWIPTARIAFPSGRPADELCPTELG